MKNTVIVFAALIALSGAAIAGDIQPFQAQPVQPSRASNIQPLTAEPVRPMRAESVKRFEAESVKLQPAQDVKPARPAERVRNRRADPVASRKVTNSVNGKAAAPAAPTPEQLYWQQQVMRRQMEATNPDITYRGR